MKRLTLVIVESPYSGEVERNMKYARQCLLDCFRRGEAPFASHLLYTQEGVLRDDSVGDRMLGIEAGLQWGKHAEKTVVYTDYGISEGMLEGIKRAEAEDRYIEYRTIL